MSQPERKAMPREGILFVLVGASGAGKNTLMKRVQAQFDDLKQLATMTTREMRAGEQEGREHWFVSHAEFKKLIDSDALVEWQQVHLDDLYGTPRKAVDEALEAKRDLIADIDFLGAEKLYEAYRENTVLIFITPSRLEILAERIRSRGDIAPEALADRLERAKFEMTFAPRCHYLVLNDEIELATEQLYRIVASERVRRWGAAYDHITVVPRHTFHTTVTALIQHEGKLLICDSSADHLLPTFPVENTSTLPHEILRAKIKQTFGCDIRIQAVADNRFDFVAPNEISIDANPPHIYLDFYYKCTLSPDREVMIPGWKWKPFSELSLPATVGTLVTS